MKLWGWLGLVVIVCLGVLVGVSPSPEYKVVVACISSVFSVSLLSEEVCDSSSLDKESSWLPDQSSGNIVSLGLVRISGRESITETLLIVRMLDESQFLVAENFGVLLLVEAPFL